MPEKQTSKDVRSLPLEQRLQMFGQVVEMIADDVGDKEAKNIRKIGNKISAFHSETDEEKREQLQEVISGMYDKLGESNNPRVGPAVVQLTFASTKFF